jgi:HAD superfamily hydrolase (TIGR01457 family)
MIRALLLDLDGTVFRGKTAIPGAEKTLEKLREMGFKLFFLTNGNNKTRAQYVQKLKKMGLHAKKDEVYSSAYATAEYVKDNHPKKSVYCISEGGISDELRAKGIKVVEDDSADIVAVGLDRNFNYKKMTIAFHAIQRGALFIATNEDPAFPVEEGSLPGAGAMVGAIERSSGVKPLLIGKPNKYGIELLLKHNNLKRSEVLIVGDRLQTDIMCGKNNKIKSVLVLTGVTKKQDLKKIKKGEKPDYVIKSINELPRLLDTRL